jgi:hypothetical protein
MDPVKVKSILVKNLKAGNELTNTMPAAVMVINGMEFPFVLQRRSRGKIEFSIENTNINIMYFNQIRKTVFTKAGYISLLFTAKKTQFWMYVKAEYVEQLKSVVPIFYF